MTGAEWKEIFAAKELLGLGDRATLGEIKRSYRKMCKIHHPDLSAIKEESDSEVMHNLTRAYELLMRYCDQYRIPFLPGDPENVEADDWWMDRFGQDPLWGKKRE